jgi:hypothetical protein
MRVTGCPSRGPDLARELIALYAEGDAIAKGFRSATSGRRRGRVGANSMATRAFAVHFGLGAAGG